ncbi:retrovirus-related pol polyprotein from transposon TNT 1-94 [Tanacetum coccineum]|uniref:Retrovirus-related pol polyprotein from transposon TNT 1-94 n=1 Tax=Tanacetum coccineum TaxID=301880 RepID=A0ABQ4ZWJ5_9ASTR
MVPRTVLTRYGPISLNTARPVNTVQPRTTVNNAGPMKNVINNANSTTRRPFNKITATNNSNLTKKVNTVKGTRVNTARPKSVISAFKGNKGNAVKASACWVWRLKHKILDHGNPQQDLKDKGVIDSGCSRHMTRNRSYLTDYEEINGGLSLESNSIGGIITRKVLFCIKTFKLLMKTNVLLKVPRRCDNGTEFKNRVMNRFCEMKGIKREFSVPRTPQQNGVAERKNRTLIEAARTMLANSKLPITFWAEVVNTACYVQNRVLVIKPHNKTPYELFLGRKPALSFMRPFGCPVTILNTINNLGNQSNGNAGTKACDDAGKARVETVPGKDYILLQLWTQDPPFSSSPKDSLDAGFKPSGEEEKKDANDPANEGGNLSEEGERINQEKDASVNNTNNINTFSPTVNVASINDNAVDENIEYVCADDLNIPDLEEIARFSDAENDDSGADINNLDTYF